MNRETELKLIKKIQNDRCVSSYSKLLKDLNLYKDVYQHLQKYISNPSDLEELTQEVMFRSFEKIENFDAERGRFRGWVLGIATHKAFDLLRTRKRQYCDITEDIPNSQRSPEEMYELSEIESVLLQALGVLKDRSLRILERFYVDGMSHEAIGEEEGLSANNVGTILYRARERWLDRYYTLLSSPEQKQSKNKQKKDHSVVLDTFSQMFDVLKHQMSRV
jgi:RNA polymerase sigma-70 factor (ECF subfamily)